jgi:integrase
MLELTEPAQDRSISFRRGRRPANKGRRYPADPPRVEEIVAVMRQAGTDRYGQRLRGLIVALWRAGLRISEALALTESDLEVDRGSVCSSVGARADVADRWGWMSGPGINYVPGSRLACRCLSGRFSA